METTQSNTNLFAYGGRDTFSFGDLTTRIKAIQRYMIYEEQPDLITRSKGALMK